MNSIVYVPSGLCEWLTGSVRSVPESHPAGSADDIVLLETLQTRATKPSPYTNPDDFDVILFEFVSYGVNIKLDLPVCLSSTSEVVSEYCKSQVECGTDIVPGVTVNCSSSSTLRAPSAVLESYGSPVPFVT